MLKNLVVPPSPNATPQGKEAEMSRRVLFKVEKNRVLVPVGEPCAFGCRYCYTRGGEVGLARTDPQAILSRLREFARETPFETIQFGYDGDPFVHAERGIMMLQSLALMNKHVNFSTKAFLADSTLLALSDIRNQMEAAGKTLSALVSLSCWDSAPGVEPHTPTPAERISTVANLKRIGVPVFIAVRPVLPHISDSEYESIVEHGILAGCDGFILGPLYVDAHRRFARFIPSKVLETTPGQTCTVSWSAHSPTWTRYEDTHRLQRLLQMIEQRGGHTFLSSADAVELVQRKAVLA